MDLSVASVHLAAKGTLWQMAPGSVNAAITLGKPAEVQVTEHSLGALPETLTVPPFSINLYSYAVE